MTALSAFRTLFAPSVVTDYWFSRRYTRVHAYMTLASAFMLLISTCLQVLYGILVQHFATLAGRSPLELDHLNALTQVLAPATAEVLETQCRSELWRPSST